MSLQDLVTRYFALMLSCPSSDDITEFADSIPLDLRIEFLSWLRCRSDSLAETLRRRGPRAMN